MRKLLVILISAVAVIGLVTTGGRTQDDVPPKDNVRTFMRAKLIHSQKVLEGLAIEDYDLIAKNSQQLSLLSQAAQWQVLQTPEYARRSGEFRRAVEELTEAGKKKNLDGATLAYVNVTMNCVKCHKYVRSVRRASLELPDFLQLEPVRSAVQ